MTQDPTTMRKLFYVRRADGRVFGGVNALSGRGFWLMISADNEEVETMPEALKWRRDGRWLSLAQRYADGQSCDWSVA